MLTGWITSSGPSYGKAAFDAVDPPLLVGWAEVGPGLLQAISTISHQPKETIPAKSSGTCAELGVTTTNTVTTGQSEDIPAIPPADQ
jgi:hypothetical protein